jgi:glutamine cyclotransferase
MRTDLTKCLAFPYQELRRTCLWVLALAAAVSIVSCATPVATRQRITPTANLTPVASLSVSSTASPTVTDPTPTPEASPTANVERTATTAPFPRASKVPVTSVPLTPLAPTEAPTAETALVYTYRIVNVFPHDQGAYTEGLVIEDGVFYEGTGLRGQSTLRRVEPQTGNILQLYTLPPEYFGEGITIWKDRIIQLTWKARLGFVYDKNSFELLGTFQYPTEGWGITHDATKLIMSDGTSTLYFWDPETFEEVGQVQVYDDRVPVTMLNELEYVQGMVYANVWQTNLIAIIDPETGQVIGWIDLEGLLEPEDFGQPVDVLNGIAYDAVGERLFVTGKLWSKLFEIELIPVE